MKVRAIVWSRARASGFCHGVLLNRVTHGVEVVARAPLACVRWCVWAFFFFFFCLLLRRLWSGTWHSFDGKRRGPLSLFFCCCSLPPRLPLFQLGASRACSFYYTFLLGPIVVSLTLSVTRREGFTHARPLPSLVHLFLLIRTPTICTAVELSAGSPLFFLFPYSVSRSSPFPLPPPPPCSGAHPPLTHATNSV